MILPDYEAMRASLVDTGDQQVIRLVRIMDPVFRRPKFRPTAASAARDSEIVADVRRWFPTPFARHFSGWADQLEPELRAALEAHSERPADATAQFEVEQKLRLRFRAATLQIETCWKQIVHFLPFLFIAALRRIDDTALRGDAAKELARALRNYNAFYVQHSLERQKEAVQYHLLVSLLKLFRQLAQRKAVGPDFIFDHLLSPEHLNLSDVFPERFDAGMLFLQEVRNRLTHGGLVDRLPADAIAPVAALIKWVFLDLVAILSIFCRSFGLNFVTRSRVGQDHAEVDTLDFSGAAGPSDERYRIDKEWQIEEYAFLPYRIYLVNRTKRIGEGTGEIMTPGDYLDLTPFLIVDRLRAASAEPVIADRQNLLFVLQQYLEPVRQMLFSDLGGTGDRLRPADPRDSEADALLRQMGDFRHRYRGLVEQVSLQDQKRLSTVQVRSALWRIARDHLATLTDPDRYDEVGTLVERQTHSEANTIYVEELYVAPKEGGEIASFLSSGKRGLVLVGDSGAGKSNVLVHHYLERLRSGELAVFLSGRRFETASFGDGLMSKVVGRITDAWTSLDALDNFLEENDDTLVVFLDAVNEYSGPLGARALLESLIAGMAADNMRRVKLVTTIRSETWSQYCAQVGQGRPLDETVFAAKDPVRIEPFQGRELCGRLYATYQAYYALRPATLEDLSSQVQDLVARPFMMGMVAETYSNRALNVDADPRLIPSELDYFSIFVRLTERKAQDAQILVHPANVADRENMPEAIGDFCSLLAEMMFERLVSNDPRLTSGRDALPVDSVSKRPELESFAQNRHAISVLEAVLQIGLLERIAIPQRNRDGKLMASPAFKFFHDQYTQFWIAAAYQRKILGWLNDERLADSASMAALMGTIDGIVRRSAGAPVLAGALDHWLKRNIENFHDNRLEPVMPLLSDMAQQGSPALRHQAVALVTNLVVRGSYPVRDIYRAVFRLGTPSLRLALVDSFVAFWPQLSPDALRIFIDCCDPRQDLEVIDRLGDVFSLHVASEPEAVLVYLDRAISPLSFMSVTEPQRLRRQSRFALQFTIFSVFSCFDRPEALQAVRGFVRAKYRSVLDLVDESEGGSMVGRIARRTVRHVLFKLFDSFGVAQWNKFIAEMEPSGNDKFFFDNGGVVQHDLLAQFLPYAVDFHNGDTANLSLAEGGPFRTLCLRMLDFRPASIIGYNAALALPGLLLQSDWQSTESLVMELLERRTPSAVFHGQLLLSNIAFAEPARAERCLALWRDRILPSLLTDGVAFDGSMSFCVASMDIERLWPTFEGLLQVFFRHFETLGSAEACTAFGDHLYKVCHCSDALLGRQVVTLMLRDRARFLGPLWRSCALKVFAALQVRSPADLLAALAAEGIDESLAREARSHQSAEIVKNSRLFPFQVAANRWTVWNFVHEPRLRHAVVKHFIGSLAAGSSIADFARGVRQTMVAIMNVCFGDHPEQAPAGRLSVAEIAASVTAARKGASPLSGVASRPG